MKYLARNELEFYQASKPNSQVMENIAKVKGKHEEASEKVQYVCTFYNCTFYNLVFLREEDNRKTTMITNKNKCQTIVLDEETKEILKLNAICKTWLVLEEI